MMLLLLSLAAASMEKALERTNFLRPGFLTLRLEHFDVLTWRSRSSGSPGLDPVKNFPALRWNLSIRIGWMVSHDLLSISDLLTLDYSILQKNSHFLIGMKAFFILIAFFISHWISLKGCLELIVLYIFSKNVVDAGFHWQLDWQKIVNPWWFTVNLEDGKFH